MKEFQKINEVYATIDFSRKKAALATVVHVSGSSYRRPGARMLITDDGRWEGAISGGCLEGDALRKARQVMLSGKPMLVTYDTMKDDESGLGVGLGCNGIIHVLIEPIKPDSQSNPVYMLQTFLSRKEKSVMATVFEVNGNTAIQVGDRIMYYSNEETISSTEPYLGELLSTDSMDANSKDKSYIKKYSLPKGEVKVFWEILHPSIELVIFGGGYDAVPVAKMAKEIGWQVIITDDCVAHLAPKRFPTADAVVHADRFSILSAINITTYTVAVLMSHNYKYDLAVLENLLTTDIAYIGILGPKKRTEKIVGELAAKGKVTGEEVLSRIHSPIGLDIGAETPDEIALAIVSEIQAFFTKRQAGFLKDRQGPIHEREEQESEISNEI